jgi:hypothetical protein
MLEIVTLAVFLLGGWFWVDSMRAREVAVDAGRHACAAENVQLLDWTVALRRTRVRRDDRGHLKLHRTYEFEYSDTGDNRLKGSVTLLGEELLTVRLEGRGEPLPPSPTYRWH